MNRNVINHTRTARPWPAPQRGTLEFGQIASRRDAAKLPGTDVPGFSLWVPAGRNSAAGLADMTPERPSVSGSHGHRQWAYLALKYCIGVVAVLACMSCGMPRTHYYTMERPHAAQGPGATNIPFHIAVQRFRAERVLMDDRILYREGPHEVNFYEYHRWASAPVDLVTDYFIHSLKDNGTYRRVSAYSEGAGSDYTLRGRLHHFEEVDRGKEVFSSVGLELELLDTKSRTLIWRGEAESTRPLTSRDMAGVVRGIFECLDETASKLLGSMQQQIEKHGH